MKTKIAVLTIAVVAAAGLLSLPGSSALAGDEVTAATSALSAAIAGGEEHEFVGSKKCKMCHSKQYKSWEETTHAKAFEILKPGERSEAKAKFKLDAAKDYTTDESCLSCHTLAVGKKGGYAVPDAADEKAVKKMAKLANVGCESCHGPGKDYCKAKKAIKKEKRKYKFEEMAALGMTKIEEGTCAGCHNDKSVTYDDSKVLKFEEMLKNDKAIHVHVPLELRED